MNSHYKKINTRMLAGWFVIILVLIVSYVGEVIKGERTVAYLLWFFPIITVPWLIDLVLYLKDPGWRHLCYPIVAGYFLMYLFVMITGSTSMVFSFILPLLSLLVLYHHPNLILFTGIASLLVNLVSIAHKYLAGQIDLSGSKDAEIQIALIVLCFGGSYISARLYESITKQNYDYLTKLHESNKEIQTLSLQTITTIAKMLDARDSYTEGHSQRVAVYSVKLGRELGMSEEELENLRKIALLHDIGKVGVPDLVLNKPGRLSDEEFDAMRQHPSTGGEIIRTVKTIPGLYDGVKYHHERYDGKGYPEGLRGEDIPFIARIISVADAYDAMTSNRVYRKHLPTEKVISEIKNGTGTQFDPVIASKMLELLDAGIIWNLSPDSD